MSKIDNGRSRAIAVLEQWERKSVSLDLLLEDELRRPFADQRDSQFCRALVYGVVRWLGYLDWILLKYSKHSLKKMKPLTRQALRTGLYQLVAMDRVPVSAAINETVKILKDKGQPRWLTGFVNGLLRRVSRELDSLPSPGQGAAQGFTGHSLLSHPQWLYDRWCERYGQERTEDLCLTNNREADLCLGLIKISPEEFIEKLAAVNIEGVKGLFAGQAVVLPEYKGQVAELPGYAEGLFLVQDEAAQLAAGLLGDKLSAGRYLDGCAGLGGKTIQLAARLADNSSLLAIEPDKRRYELLGVNLRRLGLAGSVQTFKGRLEDVAEQIGGSFKGILLDAPCSGLGVIRRHPDIRWNRKIEDLQRYQAEQLALLQIAAQLLEPGGVLVYITCSTEPEENEQVIGKFLAMHPDFQTENCRAYLPENGGELIDEQGFFRTLPDQGLDGFFGARLVKVNSEE
ncbi:MAG: 16S rRNA (cytosine(967)-C(5))-methyltransferase RsmB [Thermodesulfobacteriota bacterium]